MNAGVYGEINFAEDLENIVVRHQEEMALLHLVSSKEELIEAIQKKEKRICFNYQTESLDGLEKAVHLQELDASATKLKTLPSLDLLTNLEYLHVFQNQLIYIPCLDALVKLIVLDVESNKLKTLPFLNLLINLELLEANNNNLKTIPSIDSLVSHSLTNLDVSCNKLTAIQEHTKTIYEKYNNNNDFPKWLNYKTLVDFIFIKDD